MSELKLQRMKVELIRGGVAPKFVERTLIELDAHYRDLKSQAIADGFSETVAREKANNAIGDEKTLIKEILNKQELKSWLWRYPKSIFLLVPLLILILSIFVFGVLAFLIDKFSPEIIQLLVGTDIPLWTKVLIELLSFFMFYVLTPMLAAGIIVMAKRRIIQLHWPIAGMALLMFVGCGWGYSINWPTEAAGGNINFSWGYSFLPRGVRVQQDLHNLMNMLITISLAAITWWVYRPYETSVENS